MAIYGAMGLMTIASLLLMDRVGRRPLWIFASLLMAGATCATGFLFPHEASGWPILMILALVTVPHGIALGGIPWLMMSELFPTRLRAKAVSITTSVLWIFIFSGAYLFPLITSFSQRHLPAARNVVVQGTTISFCDSNPDTIQNSAGGFEQAGFKPGDQVTTLGAENVENRGTFEVADNQLTLAEGIRLANEPAGAEITVQIVTCPQ